MIYIAQSAESSKVDNSILSSFSPCIHGIFNYDTLHYDFISENIKHILGYQPEDFVAGGLHYFYTKISPIHADILSSKIMPLYLDLCVKYAAQNILQDLRFAYEYQIERKDGSYAWCLQQYNIIEVDGQGNPHRDLFVISDITEFKKDTTINFLVARKNCYGIMETIFNESFLTTDFSMLSARELQVLKMLCEGKSTPEIASHLSVSEHTIKSHRKNIKTKLNASVCKDVLKVAKEKGIL